MASITAAKPRPASLKEGFLLKRQRGLKAVDLRKLRFQQRFIQLSQSQLEYFTGRDRRNRRGTYLSSQIVIVEKVPDSTFQRHFCFQIGNEREVMYFAAKSEKERDAWIEAFRIAASVNSSTMLTHYHIGAYGQVDSNKWSCCGKTAREARGCQRSTRYQRTSSLIEPYSKDDADREPNSSPEYDDFKCQSLPVPAGYNMSSWIQENEESSGEDPEIKGSQELEKNEGNETNGMQMEADSGEHTKKHAIGSLSKIDAQSMQSVDSGLGMQAKYSSHGSLTSVGITTSEGFQSPQSHRKRYYYSPKSQLQEIQINIYDTSKGSKEWMLLRNVHIEKSESILKAVFRDAEMLLIAVRKSEDSVQIAATNVENSEDDGNSYLMGKSIGSIDTWRNYLAVGFPKLQVMDTNDWNWKKILQSSDQNPHFCAFKPDGSLVSTCCESDSLDICVWPPCVDLVSADSTIEPTERISIGEKTQSISSLSVSPNREQPWLAVGVKMADGSQHVKLCDCNKNQQKWSISLDPDVPYSESVVCTTFSHDGRQLAVGFGHHLKLYDPGNQEQSCLNYYHFSDASVTSLCFSPTDTLLSVGLSSGEVKVFDGDLISDKPQEMYTFPMPNRPSAVTSVAYSRDGGTFAVGHDNGVLSLWKAYRARKIDFVREILNFEVDHKALEHYLKDDAITISVPQGAVPQDIVRKIHYGVVPHGPFGPFKFPDDVRPVSAILYICPETNAEFLKPIELILPHFIDCKTIEDVQRLAVFKASHDDETSNGEAYEMRKVDDCELTFFTDRRSHIQFAKVAVKHFCCYCVGEYFREDTNKAKFCLVEAKPKNVATSKEWSIDYCLPYYLPTCIKTIEEQYPESDYNMEMQAFTFSSEDDREDPALAIEFQERTDEGWMITLRHGQNKIYRKDVCFWDIPSCKELACMCENKTYPPRFVVVVNGENATKDAVTKLTFPGSVVLQGRNECCFTHTLICAKRNKRESTIILRPPDPVSANQHVHLESALEALQVEMCDTAENADPLKLGMKLFSSKLIPKSMLDQAGAEDSKKDSFHRNCSILSYIYESLKENPSCFSLLCEALKFAYTDSKLQDKYEIIRKTQHHHSHHSHQTSGASFASAQEQLNPEQESDPDPSNSLHDNTSSDEDSTGHGLVHPMMNGAAIVIAFKHEEPSPSKTTAPLPFRQPHYGHTDEYDITKEVENNNENHAQATN